MNKPDSDEPGRHVEHSLPAVSVIMPVYNSEEFLKTSIESILSQTFRNFELIICYDDSSDRSLEIVEEYQKSDYRIKVSKGRNRGLVKSLNDGLRLSKGRYFARMDSDDISAKERLGIQLKFMDDTLALEFVARG